MSVITGGAVALHCCKAHARIIGKIENSTPVKSQPLKISIPNFAHVITLVRQPPCKLWCKSVGWGYSPTCDFLTVLSCPFFLDHAPRSYCWTDFHALWLKRCVSAQGSAFWGRTIGDVISGKYAQNLLKVGLNRQIQAKMRKSKNRTISETVHPIKPNFEEVAASTTLHEWSKITQQQIQHGWRPPSWKSLWGHNSAADGPIWMKFGTRRRITCRWRRKRQSGNRK